MKIKKIQCFVIKDSRHQDTIEVKLFSLNNFSAKASVPSGKSVGRYEAKSINPKQSLKKIFQVEKKIKEFDFKSPFDFDSFLLKIDDTEDKRNLGSNTTLALSMAFWRLFAFSQKLPLYLLIKNLSGVRAQKFPFLFFNLINGGVHAKDSLPFQEYLIIPKINSPKESLKICFDFIDGLREYFKNNNIKFSFGDEGGFTIKGDDPEIGLKIFNEVLGYKKYPIRFGLDVAASSLPCEFSSIDLFNFYNNFIEKYPILSIEDPFKEDDFSSFAKLNQKFGRKIWIIGDDLTVTNLKRIEIAKEKKAINTVLIKPNRIGTISETIEAVKKAKSFGFKVVVSHRSGETMDDFIADFAFGVGADGLKSGSPLQKERLAKYKRLIKIEKKILFLI